MLVSRAARARIARAGGDLYLWSERFGAGFDALHAAWSLPGDVRFAAWPAEEWAAGGGGAVLPGVRRVHVAEDFEPPGVLHIALGRLPRARLVVSVAVEPGGSADG